MIRSTLRDRFRRINQRSLFGPAATVNLPTENEGKDDAFPAGQARAEAVQRLQVGLFGIGAMVLLVGLASIIGSQADLVDDAAVPEAAPTTEPTPQPAQANPLVDAGVVPDIAANPSPTPSPAPLDLPPPRTSGSDRAAPSQ